MTSLYPDESYCTTDIGRLLFKPKTDWIAIARVVSSEDERSLTGTYTVYTIQIDFAPSATLSEESEKSFTIQSRFKELNKLHAVLVKLHKQLYLRGTFPTFSAPKLLGSSNPQVVEERKAATEAFFSFVLDSEVLRKSRALQEFADKAKERALTAVELVQENIVFDNATNILDASIPDSANRTTLPQPLHPTNDSSDDETNDFQFQDVAIDDKKKEERKSVIKKIFPMLASGSRSVQEGTSEDYLVKAGHLVATAQRAELEHAYELAFQCYKNAASSLMQGMQMENDMGKRNAVRRKTAQYLIKAEKLYRTFLSYDGSVMNIEAMMGSSIQDPNVIAFQCSNKSLKTYRFCGVLPNVESNSRVLLVEEKATGTKFVMKLIEKGSSEASIFLPTNIAHMVQLFKFFELENQIVLVLQYVEPGKLWNFLARYFQDCERNYVQHLVAEIGAEPSDGEDKSYTGRRVEFNVGFDFERVAALRDESQSTDVPSVDNVCTVGEDVANQSGSKVQPTGGFCIVGTSNSIMHVEEEAPAQIELSRQRISLASGDDRKPARSSEHFSVELAESLKNVRHQLSFRRKVWPSSRLLPDAIITHWAAQIVSFFFILHTEYGRYLGTLTPDDILLDTDGNIVITYKGSWFGCTKQRKLEKGYAAPGYTSILSQNMELKTRLVFEWCLKQESIHFGWEPSESSDVWTIGALLFELLSGRSLADAAPHGIDRLGDLPLPENTEVSFIGKSLLAFILMESEERRPSLDDIRNHVFFASIDWDLYDNPSRYCNYQDNLAASVPSSSSLTTECPPFTPELLMQGDVTL